MILRPRSVWFGDQAPRPRTRRKTAETMVASETTAYSAMRHVCPASQSVNHTIYADDEQAESEKRERDRTESSRLAALSFGRSWFHATSASAAELTR
jgi:hypothetical protein